MNIFDSLQIFEIVALTEVELQPGKIPATGNASKKSIDLNAPALYIQASHPYGLIMS
jgi:hypothetical protein